MNYSINLGAWNSVFAVPCSVVDKHIKLAGSNPLKVLLWALRHAGEPFEAKNVAKAIGIDTSDVNDAMLYWQQAGLVAIRDGEIVPDGSMAQEPPAPAAPEKPEVSLDIQPEEKPHKVISRPQKADNAFVAKRMNESSDVSCLMQEAEQILGRLISNGDSATLLMIHDDFGLPADVIIMLLQYVVSVGKANTRYIEKVAMNWADEEIFTHEKAEAKLRSLAENGKAWRVVEQAIGMPHRASSTKEEAAAVVWITEWHFGASLIHEAYDRSVDGTGKFSPAYMNRILERWHKDGITTLEQAKKEKDDRSSARKGDKPPKTTSTYDINEYERSGVFDNFDRK
jgi:DnaD/phage-associated family protein